MLHGSPSKVGHVSHSQHRPILIEANSWTGLIAGSALAIATYDMNAVHDRHALVNLK
jgi:hypothetical protein